MIKKLAFLVTFAITVVTVSAAITPTFAWDTEPDKPILAMKPAELFSNPQLRQLAVAAQHGDVKNIDALIAQGVDVNGKGKYGITPLFSAGQVDNKIGFEALLDHGANPNNIWTTGDTLMNLIASSQDSELLKMALEHGGDPNLVEPHTGNTPLFAAITSFDGKKNVRILIKAGANLDYQTPSSPNQLMGNGDTAMMEAAGLGNFEVVQELLEAGANYMIKNARGWDIRNVIINFNAHNLPPADLQARECVISFLKKHNFWMRIAPPADFRVSTFSVRAGGFYTLSWTKVPDAKTYDLSLNGKIKLTGVTDTEVRLQAAASEVNDSGNLGWRVRACDDKGCSDWSTVMAIAVTQGE